jgi:small-conductance mechanosensitive channel
MIALPLVGIPLSLLSVFGGALGVGLGFGLQKIASNYVSGFIILLDRSIRLGDLVTIDGRHGVVLGIKSRYTVIKGLDGTEAIIPNDSLITNTVVNHTYSDPKVAIKIGVTVDYETDLDQVFAILLASANGHARVEKTPAPAVQLKDLGDNGIEIELIVWIHDAELGQTSLRSDLLISIWRSFREAAISIPYPQRELRFNAVGVAPLAVSPTESAA